MVDGRPAPFHSPKEARNAQPQMAGRAPGGGPVGPAGFMLAQRGDEPFDSPHHIFEVLWDGLRAMASVERGAVRLQGRHGADLTALFPEITRAGVGLKTSALLDGAIVALDGDGRPLFGPLAARLLAGAPQALPPGLTLAYHAFDILRFEGRAVAELALVRRKEILRRAVRGGGIICAPDFVTGDGIALWEATRDFGIDGMVAKDLRSPYLPSVRSGHWLVISAARRGRFVIAGYTYGGRWRGREATAAGGPFTSLLLGAWADPGELRYVGEVTGGFGELANAIVQRLEPLTTRRCPFPQEPDVRRLVFWCEPSLSARVRFAGWNPGGTLRFPVFEALRPDVPAQACRLEDLPG